MAEARSKNYVLILLLMVVWSVPGGCCPDDQKAALLEFKFLIHGNSSFGGGIMSGWNASISCCEWSGVSCDSRRRFVTRLDVSYSNPEMWGVGGVSSEVLTPLFHLTSLRFLYMSSNCIEGEIPSGIGNLTRLQTLDLSYNSIRGKIPSGIGRLTRLQTLDLSGNNIRDEISYGIRNLTRLQTLHLSDNHFSGPIPPQLFSDLPHLQLLWCDGNSLEGKIPVEIGNLTNLESLNLGSNKLSGEIPVTLFRMTKLESLYLQDNLLSGEIPSVQNMTRLVTLVLEGNFLYGGIPTWLFESSTLRCLHLGRNNLILINAMQMSPKSRFTDLSLKSCNIASHGIPIWLANQTTLMDLDLSSNRITGTFPDWLAEMHISGLILADNMLQGTLPPELAFNAGLKMLDLSKNNFEGELFPNRDTNKTQRNDYVSLILSDNEFIGPIGARIPNMNQLSYLDLSRNRLSGDAFVFLCQHSYNCPLYINLSFNTFHGNISLSSDNAPYLEALEIAHNHFSKLVLPQYLENLKLLDVHDNRILGEIPTSLTHISNLQILSIGNNLLQGSIPATLSNLASLQILDLSGNKLRGKVPESLGNLTGMTVVPNDSPITYPYVMAYFNGSYHDEEPFTHTSWLEVFWKTHHEGLPNKHLGLYTFLDLSNNQLSGEIPPSLGNLKSLKVLNFSHNSLSGEIPASFGDIKELESLDLSHNNLSGEIPSSMGTLLHITDLQLSNNNLSGRIPTGPQMDRMNDPASYANNDAGLCGMQILKPCMNDVPPTPTYEAAPTGGSEELWFSWMTAGIGYPAGFVTTVLGMYGFGYFQGIPELRRRRMMMRRRPITF